MVVESLGKDNFYTECSALTGEGVDQIFNKAIQ
jgi:hypothetical protein